LNSPLEYQSPRTSWSSLLISGLCHALLLTAFVLLFNPAGIHRPPDTVRSVELVLADVSGSGETEYFEQLPETDEPTSSPLEMLDALPTEQPAPELPSIEVSPAVTNSAAPQLDAGAMTQPTGSSGFAVGGGELTAEELKAIAAERERLESLRPKGEPATVRVFGSGGLTGRSFVFLLDRSKSMGSDGLGVLDRANAELQTALSQLTPDHQFQVVGYHHETTMIDRRAMLPATAENRAKLAEFIQNLAAFGGTEHESALIVALSFKPDIIVLMTDGGLPEMTAAQLATIRRIAGKNVQIHCIQFGLGATPQGSFMRELAQENGGTYKYIDVATW
jgi:hypothetical protein